MGENSKIEWTHHTFNPWIGCTKVAEGCKVCYAESFAKRYGKAVWGDGGTRVMTSAANWRKPLKWNREAEAEGVRRRVFCASLADVFEDWQQEFRDSNGLVLHRCEKCNTTVGIDAVVAHGCECGGCGGVQRVISMNTIRNDLFKLIDATPHLDWLLLTKRPENVLKMWPIPANGRDPDAADYLRRENVWLLTSIATQADADRNVPELLKCRDLVPVLGLSAEPLVGPMDLGPMLLGWCPKCGSDEGDWGKCSRCGRRRKELPPLRENGDDEYVAALDWLIAGGESGPHARPMHPAWARSLRDQCQAAGVPFFFKQWGEYCPWVGRKLNELKLDQPKLHTVVRMDGTTTDVCEAGEAMARLGKKSAGRKLDGVTHDEYPAPQVAARV